MSASIVATRYARALSSAIQSPEEFERVASELQALATLLGDARVRAALENPAVPRARRLEIIEEVGRAARLLDKTRRFLGLLEEHGRLGAIGEASTAFSALRDEREGIVEAELTTAVPLEGSQAAEWETALGRLTGRKIRLKKRIDPAIIGGAVARIGSTVYDGSLKSRIRNMRQALTRR